MLDVCVHTYSHECLTHIRPIRLINVFLMRNRKTYWYFLILRAPARVWKCSLRWRRDRNQSMILLVLGRTSCFIAILRPPHLGPWGFGAKAKGWHVADKIAVISFSSPGSHPSSLRIITLPNAQWALLLSAHSAWQRGIDQIAVI